MVDKMSDKSKKFALIGAGVVALSAIAALVYKSTSGSSASETAEDDATTVDGKSTEREETKQPASGEESKE